MAVVEQGKNKYQIRVYMGRDRLTGKRIEHNETFAGTKRQAQKRERALKTEQETTGLVKSAALTLEELTEQFIANKRHGVSEIYLHTCRQKWRLYVLPILGRVPVGELRREDFELVYNRMLDAKLAEGEKQQSGRQYGLGLSPNTVRELHGKLTTLFHDAVGRGLLARNPLVGIKLPPARKSSISFLTIDEAKALVAVVDCSWWGPAHVFDLHTGMRPEELCGLRWSDIDLARGTITLGRPDQTAKWIAGRFVGYGPLKSKHSYRTLELAPEHLAFLEAHRRSQRDWIAGRRKRGEPYADERLIFAAYDGRTPASGVPSTALKYMLNRAGIEAEISWYGLRHTHATVLIDSGFPPNVVAERLGHTVGELMRTYAHVMPARRRELSTVFASLVPLSVFTGSTSGRSSGATLDHSREQQMEQVGA